MTSSLRPVVEFVLRERDWATVPRLARLASALPPVPCAGLEIHLDEGDRVDLQQRVRGHADRARLGRFLMRPGAPDPAGAWAAVARYCALAESAVPTDELWLELDDDPSSGVAPLSVFARLPLDSDARVSAAEPEAAVARVLAAFDVALPAARRRGLRRCLLACARGAGVSHVGVMLGRPGAPLRLIVEEIPAADFGVYLERVGLGTRAGAIQDRVDALFVYADRIRLALTLTDGPSEAIGLECFVGDPTTHDPRVRGLLEYLASEGLCRPELGGRLLGWPGRIMPHLAREGWPGTLLARALDDGAAPSWLECRISHVKLTLAGDSREHAKAYIGFIEVEAGPTAPPVASETQPAPPALAGAASDAFARGCQAILAARTQAGWWLDFPGFTEGLSDEWVTAYVATVCVETGVPALRGAGERAWALFSGRPRDGWGWNLVRPADADSTAWALRLAQALGRLDEPAAHRAYGFLQRHVEADGGVSTYLPGSHAALLPDLGVNEGWYHPHTCVTAAVAGLASMVARTTSKLLRAQEPDGSWSGYWWADPAYPTATAAAALGRSSETAARAATSRAAEWARRRLATAEDLGRDPFALALLLRTLLLRAGEKDAALVRRRAGELFSAQREDGRWVGTATLHIPNAAGACVTATDRHGIFTTATALQAWSALHAAGYGP